MATHSSILGESHGQRGLVGYSLWGCKELDTTKQPPHTHTPGFEPVPPAGEAQSLNHYTAREAPP